MNKYIRIAGVHVWFEMWIGKTKVFDGAGYIRASAIEQMSKNRFCVYAIMDHNAVWRSFGSIGAAMDYLQELYDRYGIILENGEFCNMDEPRKQWECYTVVDGDKTGIFRTEDESAKKRFIKNVNGKGKDCLIREFVQVAERTYKGG